MTEAMNPAAELYSAPRLLAALGESAASDPAGLIAQVRSDVRAFADDAEQSDDVTLVCARWNGAIGR